MGRVREKVRLWGDRASRARVRPLTWGFRSGGGNTGRCTGGGALGSRILSQKPPSGSGPLYTPRHVSDPGHEGIPGGGGRGVL